MHLVVTIFVALLSVLSLSLFLIGGLRHKAYRGLSVWASIALSVMLFGGIFSGLFPKYFGLFERFSVFSATGFNAVLGVYLFRGFEGNKPQSEGFFYNRKSQ